MPYKEFHLDKIGNIFLSLKCQDFMPFYQKIKTKSKAEYFLSLLSLWQVLKLNIARNKTI